MSVLVAVIFRVAFAPLVRVTSAALAPFFRTVMLDRAQLRALFDKVGELLRGLVPTYEAVGEYTAAEQQEMVEGVRDILVAVLTDYAITVPLADIGRLLDAVAETIVVPPPAA